MLKYICLLLLIATITCQPWEALPECDKECFTKCDDDCKKKASQDVLGCLPDGVTLGDSNTIKELKKLTVDQVYGFAACIHGILNSTPQLQNILVCTIGCKDQSEEKTTAETCLISSQEDNCGNELQKFLVGFQTHILEDECGDECKDAVICDGEELNECKDCVEKPKNLKSSRPWIRQVLQCLSKCAHAPLKVLQKAWAIILKNGQKSPDIQVDCSKLDRLGGGPPEFFVKTQGLQKTLYRPGNTKVNFKRALEVIMNVERFLHDFVVQNKGKLIDATQLFQSNHYAETTAPKDNGTPKETPEEIETSAKLAAKSSDEPVDTKASSSVLVLYSALVALVVLLIM